MKTVLNVKTDKSVKEQAQRIAEELGLPLSTIVNASLKQFIRTREVYFSAVPHMTPELEKMIGIAEKDYAEGKNVSKAFVSADEAIAFLDA